MIPARGGSQGVPRKNLRMIGKDPLIAFSIRTALRVVGAHHTIVITDSEEISAAAVSYGSQVILESAPTPSNETLDEKIVRNLPRLREMGAADDDVVLTFQPTSPLLSASSLREALRLFDSPRVDCVLSVADDRHLRWRLNDGVPSPAYVARLNRQMLPPEYRETGGVIAARLASIERTATRVHGEIKLLVVPPEEAIDIDSHADMYAAAHYLSRKKIAVRVDAGPQLGMGHVYRALALVTELARHDIKIFVSADHSLSSKFFADKPYHVERVSGDDDFVDRMHRWAPDLIVLDVLDTAEQFVLALRRASPGSKLLSFEDRGTGAFFVDLVVSEFIDAPDVPPERTLDGIDFSLLSPSFELPFQQRNGFREEVSEVLVLFGGTDPSRLAARAVESLARVGYSRHVTVVRGMGAGDFKPSRGLPFDIQVVSDVSNMPQLMARADFAFTSAGRTIIELASVGVPSICLAQNLKEMSHKHAVPANGVRFLGLGSEVSSSVIDRAVREMLSETEKRRSLAAAATNAGARRSNRRTIAEAFSRLNLGTFPNL